MSRNTVTVDLQQNWVSVAQLKPLIQAASRVSADHIRATAVERLERQLVGGVGKGFGGHPTGETAQGILVNKLRSGWGYLVDAGNLTTPLLDLWLERGTKNMPARPFFYDAARLEEGAHYTRIRDAVQEAIGAYGLGSAAPAAAAPTYMYVNPGYTATVAQQRQLDNVFDELAKMTAENQAAAT